MKVSDLAAELEVPASAVLDQCQRFGIDASWAGAELTSTDVIVLRAELASSGPLDLTGADDGPAEPVEAAAPAVVVDGTPPPAPTTPAPEPDAEPEPAARATPSAAALAAAVASAADEPAPDPAAPSEPTPATDEVADAGPAADAEGAAPALPPTAVGSMPDLIDEVTPEPEMPSSRGPGFQPAGLAGEVAPGESRTIPPREPPSSKRFDRQARNGLIALVLGALLFAASNYVDSPAAIAALWLLCAVCLVTAIVDAIRGRRHVQTHPERVSGLIVSVLTLVLGIGAVIGLGLAVFTVVGDAPAADAPASVGDLAAVQSARWGYQRLGRIADNGWERPARDAGTCWEEGTGPKRGEERVETDHLLSRVDCEDEGHTVEVVKVYAPDRDADSPYPGAGAFVVSVQTECGKLLDAANDKGANATLKGEYPTATGWADGDHDVACLLVTANRKGSLTD